MEKDQPKISVIIPSYNHAKFIQQAIQSVLDQTFQDFELLVIDDGSSDNSIEMVQSFHDNRIIFFVNEVNLGACYTVNKLIELSKGNYIALLNSDDLWEPTKLATQFDFLENHPEYAVVYTNASFIKEDGSSFENNDHIYGNIFEQPNRSRFEWLNYFFNVGNAICHPSILIRKSVYEDVGLYNPLMASLPDFEMWVRICLKYEIFIMPDKLVKFRILDNEQNASGNNVGNIIAGKFEYKQILNHFLLIAEDDYEKIFDEKVINSLNYSLAMKALENSSNFMNSWGMDLLYREISVHPSYMLPNEFTKLSKKYDIYNLEKLQVKEKEIAEKEKEIAEKEKEIQYWHDLAQSMRIKNRIKKLFGLYK